MKLFKYVSIGVIILIILLLIIGLALPSVDYSNRIEVSKSPEQAWVVFADENKMADWMYGFKSIKKISGEENMPGSKYELVIIEGGEDLVLTEEIIAYKENELYSFKFYNEDVSGSTEILFSPTESGTSITANNTLKGNGFLLNVFIPFFKNSIQAQGQNNYNLLKELIDNS